MEIVDRKITNDVAESLAQDYINDMNAIFKMAEEETLSIIEQGSAEGMTEDQLIKKVEAMF